jgi:hypothetical protein
LQPLQHLKHFLRGIGSFASKVLSKGTNRRQGEATPGSVFFCAGEIIGPAQDIISSNLINIIVLIYPRPSASCQPISSFDNVDADAPHCLHA